MADQPEAAAQFKAFTVRRLRSVGEPVLAVTAPEIIDALQQAAAWLSEARTRLDEIGSPLAGHVGNVTDSALRQCRAALLRLVTDETTAQRCMRSDTEGSS